MLELLYRLQPSDDQSRLLDPWFRSNAVAVAAVDVGGAQIVVTPSDHALVLSSAVVDALGGGAQTVSQIQLTLMDPTGATAFNLARKTECTNGAGAAVVRNDVNWSGRIVVPPLWIIQGRAVFSAGAVANQVTVWALGMLIPRGNIERA